MVPCACVHHHFYRSTRIHISYCLLLYKVVVPLYILNNLQLNETISTTCDSHHAFPLCFSSTDRNNSINFSSDTDRFSILFSEVARCTAKICLHMGDLPFVVLNDLLNKLEKL